MRLTIELLNQISIAELSDQSASNFISAEKLDNLRSQLLEDYYTCLFRPASSEIDFAASGSVEIHSAAGSNEIPSAVSASIENDGAVATDEELARSASVSSNMVNLKKKNSVIDHADNLVLAIKTIPAKLVQADLIQKVELVKDIIDSIHSYGNLEDPKLFNDVKVKLKRSESLTDLTSGYAFTELYQALGTYFAELDSYLDFMALNAICEDAEYELADIVTRELNKYFVSQSPAEMISVTADNLAASIDQVKSNTDLPASLENALNAYAEIRDLRANLVHHDEDITKLKFDSVKPSEINARLVSFKTAIESKSQFLSENPESCVRSFFRKVTNLILKFFTGQNELIKSTHSKLFDSKKRIANTAAVFIANNRVIRS